MSFPTRRSPRLKGFDYSSVGAYFVTICTDKRKQVLSVVEGGGDLDAPVLILKPYGKIVEENILRMNAIYSYLSVE